MLALDNARPSSECLMLPNTWSGAANAGMGKYCE